MKPHPRIRKTVKLTSMVLLGLLVAAWCVAPWWYTSVHVSGWSLGLSAGRLDIGHAQGGGNPIRDGWYLEAWDRWNPWRWWFERVSYSGRTFSHWNLYIPLWIPIALSVVVFALVRRLDILARGRAHLILCPKCNYDRAGLAKDAICPECGAPSA